MDIAFILQAFSHGRLRLTIAVNGQTLEHAPQFFTLGLINMRDVLIVKGYRAEAADILAPVCETSAAGVGHLISADRTFVARYFNDLDNIRVVAVSAHSDLYPLGKYGALLINAASHGRRIARDDDIRDIEHILQQRIVPCLSCHLAEDLIFKVLYLCIEFPQFQNNPFREKSELCHDVFIEKFFDFFGFYRMAFAVD